MGEQNPDKNPANEIKMQIYLGNGNDTFGMLEKEWQQYEDHPLIH